MTPGLVVEPEAERELEEAVSWYEQQRPGLGARLLDSVAAAVQRLRRFPHSGASVPDVPADLPARQILVPGFPYSVIYLPSEATVYVLAFAHQRRKPGYWHDRH